MGGSSDTTNNVHSTTNQNVNTKSHNINNLTDNNTYNENSKVENIHDDAVYGSYTADMSGSNNKGLLEIDLASGLLNL